jgi:hypothetical protein
MAIFVTLFAASEAELDGIFPGWPRAPAQAQGVTVQDAESGQERVVKRWVPEAGFEEFEPPRLEAREPERAPILAPESEYEQHMEARAPVVLRALEHACLKNLFGEHLDALAAVVLGRQAEGRPVRVTPDGFPIDSMDVDAVAAIARLQASELAACAEQWAAAAQGFEGAADALWALRRVHALAQACTSSGRVLCLWAEM